MAQTMTADQRATFKSYVREWMGQEFHGVTVAPDEPAEVVAGLRHTFATWLEDGGIPARGSTS